MGIQDRLKRMKETYAQDRKGMVEWDAQPGTYNGIVEEATIFESKKGKLFIRVKFAIASGDHAGHRYTFLGGIEDEVPRRINFGFLKIMGCQLPADIMELEDDIAAWGERHPKIKFQIVKKGEYLNFKPIRILALDTDPDDIPEVPDEDDDGGTETHVEAEVEEEAEDGEELKVGSFVEVEGRGEGTVTEINEDAGLAQVKLAASGDVEWFGGDVLNLIEKLTTKRSTAKKGS